MMAFGGVYIPIYIQRGCAPNDVLLIVLIDSAFCYVRLHGYGLAELPEHDDWYTSVALNGVVYANATFPDYPAASGFITYIVHPNNCTASDMQFFDTFDNHDDSTRFINYLQDLADGSNAFHFTAND